MVEIKRKLREVVEPILEGRAAFLVDISIGHERGARLLQVFVDTDDGVTIDECAAISRELGPRIDQANLFEGPYHLVVSSPGLGRPLQLLRQYRKNIGRRFRVRYRRGEQVVSLAGTLEAVEESHLKFIPDGGEPVTVEFSEIIESKEELPW